MSKSRNIADIGSNDVLETTSTGIDVTGTVVSDGLDVAGSVKLNGNYPDGTRNTALGSLASGSVTTGAYNTALGYGTLYQQTTMSGSTAVGYQAMTANTDGAYNSALGYRALYTNTTGGNNTGLGHSALTNSTTGSANTAIGKDALRSNTTASNNTAVGCAAGYNNTTGTSNTAIGQQALYLNTTGIDNTAIGDSALDASTTASYNTAIGRYAGTSLTTGTRSTFIGRDSGSEITTGDRNTILGRYNGNQGGLDIRTSSNNVVLSDGDGNPRLNFDSSGRMYVGTTTYQDTPSVVASFKTGGSVGIEIGADDTFYSLWFVRAGVQKGYTQTTSTGTTYNTGSDARLKTNIETITNGTELLKQINPVEFDWIEDETFPRTRGFIAQELKEVAPEAVAGEPDGEIMMGVDYGRVTPILVAALQEALTRIETLEAKVATL